jgi:hypothetical protein
VSRHIFKNAQRRREQAEKKERIKNMRKMVMNSAKKENSKSD